MTKAHPEDVAEQARLERDARDDGDECAEHGHCYCCGPGEPCCDCGAIMPELVPVPMILHCPKCHVQHIDAATETWANPPHRSHLCLTCGCIWRPADIATEGVAEIETSGAADTWFPS